MAGKEFNVTGLCNPTMHYMVDISAKLKTIIRDYIDPGKYFVINRARQYGKTTTFSRLQIALNARYIVLRASFERLGSGSFESEKEFVDAFTDLISTSLKRAGANDETIATWRSEYSGRVRNLADQITSLVSSVDKPIVLMIDEVDKSANNQLFLDFLGALRDMYLDRNDSAAPAFHSVILAGVTDIKNLKAKIRPDEQHRQNSPWNIAASFDVDMSFSAPEIMTMLDEYEADRHSGMDVKSVAERLYYHTGGYPFLVSALCKIIHDEKMYWSQGGVDNAVKRILVAKNTLFDDVIKNLQAHPGFAKLVERIILEGKRVEYNPDDPNIQIGIMYGIFAHEEGQVRISNLVFSTRLMNYFVSTSETNTLVQDQSYRDASIYIKGGVLDFDKVLERFSVFMADEYRDKDSKFVEHEARRLLIGYIKPIINGRGQYFLEPEIRGGQRIDLLVQHEQTEYVIEVKIWRGEAYEQRAYDQIARYVKARHGKVGYVVSFCDLQKSPRRGGLITRDGVEIHEVIVAYKDSI
jgi:hypothetical protein